MNNIYKKKNNENDKEINKIKNENNINILLKIINQLKLLKDIVIT